MAIITKDEVLKIAHMSRIAIRDDEVDAITTHLESVLAYASRVNEVATVSQDLQASNTNIFREDEVILFNAERIKQEAPDSEEDYFVVPAILEHE